MKTSFKLLMTALVAVSVISCDELPGGGSDNGGNGDGPGSGSVAALPYVAPEDRIVAREEFGNIEYYEYDQQGRLAKITCCRKYDSEVETVSYRTTTFSYEGLLVQIRKSDVVYEKLGEYDSLVQSTGKDTFLNKGEDLDNIRWTEGVLNAYGRFSAMTYYRNEHDGFHNEYKKYCSGVAIYTYNSEGNPISVVEKDFNADGTQNGTPDACLYSWKDGNVEYLDWEDDVRLTFSFLDTEYVWPGVNIYYDLDATDFYGDVDPTGLDGFKWANLLDKVSVKNPKTNQEEYCQMVYTYDAKGRVKTVNYKWCAGGEEYFDEDDAVTFYYGDEDLPESPVSVPVYLVKQEYVSHQMDLHKLNDVDGYLGDATAFDIIIKLRNVFSDGSTKEYTQVNFGDVSLFGENHYAHDITPADLDELRSYSGPNLSVLHGQYQSENYLMAVCDYPVIGEIEQPIMLRQANESYLDPQEYVIYDQSEGGMVTKKLDIFTADFLRSKMNASYTLSKVESWTDDSCELWRLEQTITLNLWNNMTGIQPNKRIVNVELYVQMAE